MRFKEWLQLHETEMHGGIYDKPTDWDNTNLGCASKWRGPPRRPAKENRPPDEMEPHFNPEKKFGFDKRNPPAETGHGDINTKRRAGNLMYNPQIYS